MAEKSFKGISVITAGPALGHEMVIDATTLEQVVEMGNEAGQVKVLSDHSGSINNIFAYLENFRLDGGRVRADLTLFESHPGYAYFSELISTLPSQIGFSISFDGYPETAEDGTRLARLKYLASCDLVLRPAANPTGVFHARVDNSQKAMTETPVAPAAKLEAPVEAPAAPAAPVTEPAKLAEPTLADISSKLDAIMALLSADASEDAAPEMPEAHEMAAKTEDTKLEAAVVESPAAVEPAVESSPVPVAAQAKTEETNLSTPEPVPAVIAAKMIELEASRGVKPLEVESGKPLSRGELLAQFNAEKNPRRAAEIFKQIKFAR